MTNRTKDEKDTEVEEQESHIGAGLELTESEWAHAYLRRGQGDAQQVFDALGPDATGTITLIPDPEPEPAEEEVPEGSDVAKGEDKATSK